MSARTVIFALMIFLGGSFLGGCFRNDPAPVRLQGADIKIKENRAQELASPDGRFLAFFHTRFTSEGEVTSLHVTALDSEAYGAYFSSEDDRSFRVDIEGVDVYWARDGALVVVDQKSQVVGKLRYDAEGKRFKWSPQGAD